MKPRSAIPKTSISSSTAAICRRAAIAAMEAAGFVYRGVDMYPTGQTPRLAMLCMWCLPAKKCDRSTLEAVPQPDNPYLKDKTSGPAFGCLIANEADLVSRQGPHARQHQVDQIIPGAPSCGRSWNCSNCWIRPTDNRPPRGGAAVILAAYEAERSEKLTVCANHRTAVWMTMRKPVRPMQFGLILYLSGVLCRVHGVGGISPRRWAAVAGVNLAMHCMAVGALRA